MAENTKTNTGILAKAQKRLARTKTKVLQNLGKAEKTKDETFNTNVSQIEDLQETTHPLHKELNNYIHCVKSLSLASKRLHNSLQTVYEDEWDGKPLFMEQMPTFDLLWNDYIQNFQDSVLTPMNSFLQHFPAFKSKIAKRGRKMVDYDNTRHHLEVLQSAKKKDEAKIEKADEDMKEAKRIYDEMNNELLTEMPAFYKSRAHFFSTLFTSLFGVEYVFHSEVGKINASLGDVCQKLANQSEPMNFHLNTSMSVTSENGNKWDHRESSSGPSTPVASSPSLSPSKVSDPFYTNQADLEEKQLSWTSQVVKPIPTRKAPVVATVTSRNSAQTSPEEKRGLAAPSKVNVSPSESNASSDTSSVTSAGTKKKKVSMLAKIKKRLSGKTEKHQLSQSERENSGSGSEEEMEANQSRLQNKKMCKTNSGKTTNVVSYAAVTFDSDTKDKRCRATIETRVVKGYESRRNSGIQNDALHASVADKYQVMDEVLIKDNAQFKNTLKMSQYNIKETVTRSNSYLEDITERSEVSDADRNKEQCEISDYEGVQCGSLSSRNEKSKRMCDLRQASLVKPGINNVHGLVPSHLSNPRTPSTPSSCSSSQTTVKEMFNVVSGDEHQSPSPPSLLPSPWHQSNPPISHFESKPEVPHRYDVQNHRPPPPPPPPPPPLPPPPLLPPHILLQQQNSHAKTKLGVNTILDNGYANLKESGYDKDNETISFSPRSNTKKPLNSVHSLDERALSVNLKLISSVKQENRKPGIAWDRGKKIWVKLRKEGDKSELDLKPLLTPENGSVEKLLEDNNLEENARSVVRTCDSDKKEVEGFRKSQVGVVNKSHYYHTAFGDDFSFGKDDGIDNDDDFQCNERKFDKTNRCSSDLEAEIKKREGECFSEKINFETHLAPKLDDVSSVTPDEINSHKGQSNTFHDLVECQKESLRQECDFKKFMATEENGMSHQDTRENCLAKSKSPEILRVDQNPVKDRTTNKQQQQTLGSASHVTELCVEKHKWTTEDMPYSMPDQPESISLNETGVANEFDKSGKLSLEYSTKQQPSISSGPRSSFISREVVHLKNASRVEKDDSVNLDRVTAPTVIITESDENTKEENANEKKSTDEEDNAIEEKNMVVKRNNDEVKNTSGTKNTDETKCIEEENKNTVDESKNIYDEKANPLTNPQNSGWGLTSFLGFLTGRQYNPFDKESPILADSGKGIGITLTNGYGQSNFPSPDSCVDAKVASLSNVSIDSSNATSGISQNENPTITCGICRVRTPTITTGISQNQTSTSIVSNGPSQDQTSTFSTGISQNENPTITCGICRVRTPTITTGISQNQTSIVSNDPSQDQTSTFSTGISQNQNPTVNTGISLYQNPTTTTGISQNQNPTVTTGISHNQNPTVTTGISHNQNPSITTGISQIQNPTITTGISQNQNPTIFTSQKEIGAVKNLKQENSLCNIIFNEPVETISTVNDVSSEDIAALTTGPAMVESEKKAMSTASVHDTKIVTPEKNEWAGTENKSKRFEDVLTDIVSKGPSGLKRVDNDGHTTPPSSLERHQAGDIMALVDEDSSFHLHDAMLSRLQILVPVMDSSQGSQDPTMSAADLCGDNSRPGSWDSLNHSELFLDTEENEDDSGSKTIKQSQGGEDLKMFSVCNLEASLAGRRAVFNSSKDDDDSSSSTDGSDS